MARTVLLVSGDRLLTGAALRSLGCSRQPAWVFTPRPIPGPALRSRWCAGVMPPTDGADLPAAIASAARAVAATHVVADTVQMCAELTAAAAELAPTLTFPTNSAARMTAYDHKAMFAEVAVDIGLPMVPTRLVCDAAAAAEHGFDYPVVVKPAEGSGSFGFRKLGGNAELERVLRNWPRRPQVIQPYIDGSDVHVSFLADHGDIVAWEIREPYPPAAPTPGAFRWFHDGAVLEIAQQLATSTAYHGIANVDLRRDTRTGRYHVLELNPRVFITIDLLAQHGFNLLELGLDLADGRRPDAPVVAPAGLVYSVGAVKALLRSRPGDLLGAVTWRTVKGALADLPFTLSRRSARAAQHS